MAYNPTFYLLNQASGNANGYSYRRSVTIDHTKVGSTSSTNFPVLFTGTYSYLATLANGGKVTNANGYDIIFTSDVTGLVKLDHEIEQYTAASGLVTFWVRVPSVSNSVDTVIYLWYGNSSITTTQAVPTGVWDANYLAVYHLPDGTTLTTNDSTSNAYNMTNTNTATATSGKIYGAAAFNGSNQFLTNASISSTSVGSVTFSFWNFVATSGLQVNGTFGFTGNLDSNRIGALVPSSNKYVYWSYGNYTNGLLLADYTSYLDALTLVHLTYDSTTHVHEIFLNGVSVASSTFTNTPSTRTGFNIAKNPSDSGDTFHKGNLDEFRISTSARSSSWILAEYNNQNSPSTFYAIGSEV